VRIGIDSGGTFTDVVAVDGGELRVLKLPSSRDEAWRPVIDGARAVAGDAGIEGRNLAGGPSTMVEGRNLAGGPSTIVDELVHSTTVATNALLERRGGPALLVTTAGFEDVLELARQTRPELYALHPRLPAPLVDASLRLGLDERLAADGSVLRAPDAAALAALRDRVEHAVRTSGVRAIAVCLLHSYANGAHERLVAETLAPLGLPISLSSDVLPLMREYERTSTTVVDAYVKPVVAPYLARLGELAPGTTRVRVMQSSGGATSAAEAAARPVRTLLSGPAAGVIGAQAIARADRIGDVITFDMGGTSTDVALIVGGEVAATDEAEVAGCALQLPMLAVHTVGAGGGSIVWRDGGGALKVGPESAGAEPGPAAYDRGGTRPTITDANVVLGRLPPTGLLGGAMALSRARAHAVIAELAQVLGVSVERAAEDALAVAAAVMARAIKVISVERGHDPAGCTLLPFGGAGGLHACAVARELGMTRILVPPSPGLLCAYGALAADVVHEVVVTVARTLPAGARLAPETLAADFLPLTAAATRALDADVATAPARGHAVLRRPIVRAAGGARPRGHRRRLRVPRRARGALWLRAARARRRVGDAAAARARPDRGAALAARACRRGGRRNWPHAALARRRRSRRAAAGAPPAARRCQRARPGADRGVLGHDAAHRRCSRRRAAVGRAVDYARLTSAVGRGVLKVRTEAGRREEPEMLGTTRELARRPVTEKQACRRE
jgi:N-methylhydantoinase A